jgi:mannose-6-phosphate isomerase
MIPLVRSPWFQTLLLDIDKPFRQDLIGIDSFVVVMCLEGSGTLLDAEPLPVETDAKARKPRLGPSKGHQATLRQGETLLVPATSRSMTFTPGPSGLKLLLSHL